MTRGRMMHDIICPNCDYFFSVREPYIYFQNEDQRCDKCGAEIKTGKEGLDEQIILHLKRDGSPDYAVMLYYYTTQREMKSCENYVKELAIKNNIDL